MFFQARGETCRFPPEYFFDCGLQQRHPRHVGGRRYPSTPQHTQHLLPQRGLHRLVTGQLVQRPGQSAGDLKGEVRVTGELIGRSSWSSQRWGRSYRVHSCQEQLSHVAVDSLHGQTGPRQEVGEISPLHLLSAGDLLRLGSHSLVDVTLGCRRRR